jgi:hypothetical protein
MTTTRFPVLSDKSNHFSSVSPSVYIGFSSLYAYDYCGTVGESFTNTTIAFDQSELSTIQFVPTTSILTLSEPVGNSWTTYISTESYYTSTTPALLNYEVLGQNCSTIAGYTYVPGNPTAGHYFSSKFVFCPLRLDDLKSVDVRWN